MLVVDSSPQFATSGVGVQVPQPPKFVVTRIQTVEVVVIGVEVGTVGKQLSRTLPFTVELARHSVHSVQTLGVVVALVEVLYA